MDAVVLVGGSGTRLRPLTLRTPKPMLPLVDRPLLAYMFDQLADAGVDRAILACGYLPAALVEHFGDGGDVASGLALEYVIEPEPLGTAGAARLAAAGRVHGTFLLLNGDILSEHDLGALVALHRRKGASATIGLVQVDDPSRYGIVELDDDGTVLRFVEKPAPGETSSDLANAGAYVLEPSVLDLIPVGRAVSIEREVFPQLVGHGLAALAQTGYWS
ncbi:MAG: nucleotidyltransferase family protein, partial [Gaiellales bacterium]